MKKKLQKFGIILGIMSIFGNNKKHNDKFLKEFRNRIMMKILSIIPTSLINGDKFHEANTHAITSTNGLCQERWHATLCA